MSEQEIFYTYLKERGLKRTSQRDIILDFFLKTEDHISPEDLFLKIRKDHPTVGFSTVYRTLKILSECDLARETVTKEGIMVFEHNFNHPHHDHMVCEKCGRYIEFYDEGIEALQEKIAKKHDFIISHHRMDIYGICSICAKKYNF